jgi:GGDEF domain-containing protein
MNDRNIQNIKSYLQTEEVQKRISENMLRRRSEVTVTIGRVAELFGFTENQLRDWDRSGLLKPSRSIKPESPEQEGRSHGQRQYAPDELDKLAIIKELIEEGGYAPGSIPQDIDRIWGSIASELKVQTLRSSKDAEHLHIDKRIDIAYEELFWRYYGSHILRLSLVLICQDIPDTVAGLVLPLNQNDTLALVHHPSDLPKVGESLIGWLGLNQSFYTFLDPAPSFEYPTDFRVVPLQAQGEEKPKDKTIIIVQRKARPLELSIAVVEIIRRLLAPLYEVKDWRPYFGLGMRDLLYLAPDLISSTNLTDDSLNGFADMIVRLGGQTYDGQQRWRFCCIMLPEDPTLPLQQRSLIVRAQSKNSPHKVGVTAISPGKYVHSLSLRAFQSGRIIYRRKINSAESTIAFRELEGPTRSAIAVPVGSEEGQPLAILYVVSDEVAAFATDDQRVLRMIGRIVEELLMTYHARHHITQNLSKLIITPTVVDPLFKDFFSENEFVEDVETFLTIIKTQMDETKELISRNDSSVIDHESQFGTVQVTEEVISFISIDVDNQSYLADVYGNEMTRNLSRTIGLRVKEMMQTLITKHTDSKLYHIYADRYYLLLKGIPLEQARAKAEAMRESLAGSIAIERPTPPARSIVIPDITVRLGVASYTYKKLAENLSSDNPIDIVAEVRAKIASALDASLNMGKGEGGNVVMSWEREAGKFRRYRPK